MKSYQNQNPTTGLTATTTGSYTETKEGKEDTP